MRYIALALIVGLVSLFPGKASATIAQHYVSCEVPVSHDDPAFAFLQSFEERHALLNLAMAYKQTGKQIVVRFLDPQFNVFAKFEDKLAATRMSFKYSMKPSDLLQLYYTADISNLPQNLRLDLLDLSLEYKQPIRMLTLSYWTTLGLLEPKQRIEVLRTALRYNLAPGEVLRGQRR